MLSRLPNILAIAIVLSCLASTASAQGFTLNPFTKREPEPNEGVRRSISDTPPPTQPASPFQLPKLSLPTPQLPKLPELPLPKWQLPGMGMGNQQQPANGPRQPNMLQQLNRNTTKFFKNTGDFLTAPFRPAAPASGTPARQMSNSRMTNRTGSSRSRRSNQSGGLLTLPTLSLPKLPAWLGGPSNNASNTDPPPRPDTVNGFLRQERPGFERR